MHAARAPTRETMDRSGGSGGRGGARAGRSEEELSLLKSINRRLETLGDINDRLGQLIDIWSEAGPPKRTDRQTRRGENV